MASEIDCKLRRFNPRRAARGSGAVEVEIDGEILWMTIGDIKKNKKLFGPLQGLLDAERHYTTNEEFPPRE